MENKETMTSFNEWLDAQHNEHELSALLEGTSLRDVEREVDLESFRTDMLFALGVSLATSPWRVVAQIIAELEIRENLGAIIEGIQYAFDKFPAALSNRAPIQERHERSAELTVKDKVRQMLHSTDDAWIEAYLETKRKSVAEQAYGATRAE